MPYWLMKSEPDVYSYDDLVSEGEGMWDGVRNHTAAIHLRTMKVGDEAFFYHSNIGKGIGKVIQNMLTASHMCHFTSTETKCDFYLVSF